MPERKFLQADWTHVYTDGSAEFVVGNESSCMFVRTLTGQTASYANDTCKKCSNFKAKTSALQTAIADNIAVIKP